jgi:hypothetical protein
LGFGEMNLSDLNVVAVIVGGVGADEHAVDRVILVGGTVGGEKRGQLSCRATASEA